MAAAVPLRTRSAKPGGWASAVDQFLSERALSPGSRRIYRLTLERVGTVLDDADIATWLPDHVMSK